MMTSAIVRPMNWPSPDSETNMKASAETTSLTEAGKEARYVPAIRADATIEELDEWVRALGGRELTPEESARVRAEVRWHPRTEDVPEGVSDES